VDNHLRKKRRFKSDMTIIVGITSKDSIVLASDSRTSYGTRMRNDANKIIVLELKNAHALVAQSGNVESAGRFLEILTQMASQHDLSDYRTVADMAEASMRKLREIIRTNHFDCDSETLQRTIANEELNCEFLIGHFWDGKPRLFNINIFNGIASLKQNRYWAIGCGADIADYIFSRVPIGESQDTRFITATAIYAVEEVKQIDSACGGLTQVAEIDSRNRAVKHPLSKVEKLVQPVLRMAEEERRTFANRIIRSIGEVSNDYPTQ
jgi:20S proteasome alpha/beta subunit